MPRPGSKTEIKNISKAKSKAKSKTKSKTKSKAKAEAKVTNFDVKSKTKIKTKSKSKSKSKLKSKSKCPKNQIMRSGYTRSTGTVVSKHCIEDRGKPGHSVQLFKLVPGVLEKYGYHGIKSVTRAQRRNALDNALKKGFDPLSLFRRINALYVLNKNQNPDVAKLFKKDRDYIKTTNAYANRETVKKSLRRSKSKSKKSKSK